jgi:phytoene dehydrogenase-like protein
MVDGDIAGGVFRGRQVLFRPVIARVPYATPDPSIFLCSAATPPGPGVHGMGGYHAARVALHRVFHTQI